LSFVPPEFLEELKSRLNISDVVRSKIDLKKHGNVYKACCPFHNEKTPSFVVDDKRGNYHCFGCGEHGDIFSFIMKHDGVDFPTAIERLATMAGISVPKTEVANPEKYQHRTALYELMEKACVYFEKALLSPAGKIAQDYIVKRGITKKALKDFRLGYAPHGNDLISHLEKLSFTKEQMKEAGLIRENDRGTYCFFRNRLMFPVIDKRGRVVAFSARILEGEGPKYINSQETPIYTKGALLYGNHLIRKEKEIFVVEGNVDVIAMHIAGFKGTVAPLGTALTEAQISELWKLSNCPTLCFDGDSAGYKAGARAIDRALPILKPDYSMNLVFMPKGEDPDSLIKKKGVEKMRAILKGAKSLFDCLWMFETENVNINTPEGKAGFEANMKKKIGEIADASVKNYYFQTLREKLFNSRKSKKSLFSVKPKSIKAARDLNLKAIMASLLNYPEIFSEFENDLLNIEILFKSKLYADTHAMLEDEMMESADLIEQLKENGYDNSISKVLNDEVYIHFPWLRNDSDINVVKENIRIIISETLKSQTKEKNREYLKSSELSDEELSKLLEKKREMLKK